MVALNIKLSLFSEFIFYFILVVQKILEKEESLKDDKRSQFVTFTK